MTTTTQYEVPLEGDRCVYYLDRCDSFTGICTCLKLILIKSYLLNMCKCLYVGCTPMKLFVRVKKGEKKKNDYFGIFHSAH